MLDTLHYENILTEILIAAHIMTNNIASKSDYMLHYYIKMRLSRNLVCK